MNLEVKLILKAAAKTAAFFIFILSLLAVNRPKTADTNLDGVKKRVINLLIQKQKKQALSTINNYLTTETNKTALKEAREFRMQIAKKFLTKEAQEFYEMSINLSLDNPKEAKKNNDECLALDPDQLDCLIQQLRLSFRSKKKKATEPEDLEKLSRYFDAAEFNWIKVSVEKNSPDFKNLNFYRQETVSLTEEKLVLAILETDRAMAAKNFSRAKEVLSVISVEHSDWPDLIHFKNRIDFESSENKSLSPPDLQNQYVNKCKSLSKSIVRKYRYDFELCQRGL